MSKAVIGGRNYEFKRVTYHLGSPILGHYTVTVKFKEGWWNGIDVAVKNVEEGNVVLEAAYALFYK